ncbi:MAG: DUF2062 domain-containing protein [Nitrospirae bacterium]|nr:MAG: DUF2062 domain-containing protein [Nitrospirota bacterium]
MALLERMRSYLTQILHLHEPPHRTALAFAVGAFIAFAPIYPHTLLVIFCIWAFRLNLIALLAGASINNPMTIVPILGATLWIGFHLMGMPQAPTLSWSHLSFTAIYEQMQPYAVPFLVGGTVLSVLGAVVSYPTAYALISKYRRRRPPAAENPLPPETGLR